MKKEVKNKQLITFSFGCRFEMVALHISNQCPSVYSITFLVRERNHSVNELFSFPCSTVWKLERIAGRLTHHSFWILQRKCLCLLWVRVSEGKDCFWRLPWGQLACCRSNLALWCFSASLCWFWFVGAEMHDMGKNASVCFVAGAYTLSLFLGDFRSNGKQEVSQEGMTVPVCVCTCEISKGSETLGGFVETNSRTLW